MLKLDADHKGELLSTAREALIKATEAVQDAYKRLEKGEESAYELLHLRTHALEKLAGIQWRIFSDRATEKDLDVLEDLAIYMDALWI